MHFEIRIDFANRMHFGIRIDFANPYGFLKIRMDFENQYRFNIDYGLD